MNLDSMQDVNWKVGAFRLWMVLSVVWLVSSVVVFAPSALAPMPTYTIDRSRAQNALDLLERYKSGAMNSEQRLRFEEMVRTKKIEQESRVQVTIVTTGTKAFFPMTMSDEAIKSHMDEYFAEWQLRNFVRAGSITLAPPIAAFLLGLMLAWVIQGMKPRRTIAMQAPEPPTSKQQSTVNKDT